METTRLQTEFDSCIILLRGLGIPVSHQIIPTVEVNTRAKKRLGCCVLKEGKYTIEVSHRLLQPGKDQLLRETLMHELLHTCPGCGNHGSQWKLYAKLVNEAYGLSITRTVTLEETASLTETGKYHLICQGCGAEILRLRMSKVVKYPHKYRCSKCGGKLERRV